jgi:hypothetical protein
MRYRSDNFLSPAAPDQRVIAAPAVDGGQLRVREDAVDLIDQDHVVAAACVDHDAIELAPVEAEVGHPVVPDIDLEDVRCSRPQTQGQRRVSGGSDDVQATVLNPCPMGRAVGAHRLVLSSEARLESGRISQVRIAVGVEIKDFLARRARRDVGPELTENHLLKVAEIHVSVVVGIAWNGGQGARTHHQPLTYPPAQPAEPFHFWLPINA